MNMREEKKKLKIHPHSCFPTQTLNNIVVNGFAILSHKNPSLPSLLCTTTSWVFENIFLSSLSQFTLFRLHAIPAKIYNIKSFKEEDVEKKNWINKKTYSLGIWNEQKKKKYRGKCIIFYWKKEI